MSRDSLNAGDLRHRVTIQRPNVRQDATGQEVPDPIDPWLDVATVWAEVRELSGRELTQARQRQGLLTHEIKMRWRAAVDETMRLIFGDRALNVLGPPRNPDGMKVALMIDAAAQTTGSL